MTTTLAATAATLWDAIIIGAGPAGSMLALDLTRRGLRVLLLDQSPFPRSKVCGGCLNGNALAALTRLRLADLPMQLGGQPIRSLLLGAQGCTANLSLDASVSISRLAFDAALTEHCVRAGVTFQCGVRASMENAGDDFSRVILRSAAESVGVKGRIAILAHGLKAGAIAPHSRIGAGVILAESPAGYPASTISLAVGKNGYVGAVQVEEGRFDLAAAFDAKFVQESGSLGHAAAQVLRQAGFPAIPELEHAPWRGTPFLTRRPKRIAGQRWFAVGDAAGYVEPFTGEGMAWAMSGALALAPIVSRAVADWDDAHARLWTQLHARLIRRRQLQCRVLAKVLRSERLSSWMVRLLALCPTFAVPFVHNLSRPTTRFRGVAS
ncbi:FAD-dependent oxidoreductase [soil metagenome]